jgi:hypothetical protein
MQDSGLRLRVAPIFMADLTTPLAILRLYHGRRPQKIRLPISGNLIDARRRDYLGLEVPELGLLVPVSVPLVLLFL